MGSVTEMLQQCIDDERKGFSDLQKGIQSDQNEPANLEADIAQQQANEDAAAAQFAAAQQDNAPDPNGGWDPSSDPLSPAPANDPSPDPAPQDPAQPDDSGTPTAPPTPPEQPINFDPGSFFPTMDTVEPNPYQDFLQKALSSPLQAALDALRYLQENNPLMVDPEALRFANAAQKFAQDYGPLLDVLQRCTGLGSDTMGQTTQFVNSGGQEQANRDFDSLNLANVTDRGNGLLTGQLPDGRTVAVYNDSSGGWTLEIQSGTQRGKIRYGQ